MSEFNKTVGIISDTHQPFCEKKAYKVAIDYLKEQQLSELIINGDFLDFYKVSSFVKTAHQRMTFADELDLGKAELSKLRDAFPDIPIQFVVGNHEDRYNRFILGKAQELFGVRDLSLPQILGLKELKINYVDNKARLIRGNKPLIRGGFVIAHGPEIVKAGGINLARSYLLKTFDNGIYAHHHAQSECSIRRLGGGYMRVYMNAGLCELNQEYLPHNNWNHGFTVLHYNSKNRVSMGHVRQIRIDESFKIRD